MKKKILSDWLLPLIVAGLIPTQGKAAEQSGPINKNLGWYAGLEGGVPFGVSTFSSFGADNTYAGFDVGLYGGYRFNPVLSLEAALKWGRTTLSSQECCINAGYWLGSDGQLYNVPVRGMNGWGYGEVKSSVFMQNYGVMLNINLLGFFNRTKHSRWTLELAPGISALGTNATIKDIADGTEVLKGNTRWHLGVNGNVQAGCRIGKYFYVGVYSGITRLTGRRMDGVPEHTYKQNFIWESGLRLGVVLGKKRKSVNSATPLPPEPTVCPEDTTTAKAEISVQQTPTPKPSTEVQSKRTILPTIYFDFNSAVINSNELPKLKEIKRQMDEHPDLNITVDGWSDTEGSKAANERTSLRRATAVKNWLVLQGISAERISVKGHGSDFNEPDEAKARRAESNERKEAQQ
ncbi:MAG: OmpA family protein [Paraprevotella sp.]|nr:OmpA family protein [Paraprevotella sp.]